MSSAVSLHLAVGRAVQPRSAPIRTELEKLVCPASYRRGSLRRRLCLPRALWPGRTPTVSGFSGLVALGGCTVRLTGLPSTWGMGHFTCHRPGDRTS